MRIRGAFEEKSVGCALVGGAVLFVLSLTAIYMFGLGGFFHSVATRNPNTGEVTDAGDLNLLPIMYTLLFISVLLMLAAIGYGFWRNSKDTVGVRRVEQNLKILARYAYDRGNMLNSDYEIEAAEKPKFYVRAMYQDGSVEELQLSEAMYHQCGEGMFGEAEIQSRWMGRFTPYIGAPVQPNNWTPGQ